MKYSRLQPKVMKPFKKTTFMQTYLGKHFYPLEPDLDDIHITDIAHALSLQCRFAGHCKEFYSVAQHCVIVSDIITEKGGNAEEAFCGLLHDATEAYLVDVPRPVKKELHEYQKYESILMGAIRLKFTLPEFSDLVWEADNLALALEAKHLMGNLEDWDYLPKAPDMPFEVLEPIKAKSLYLDTFSNLASKLINKRFEEVV